MSGVRGHEVVWRVHVARPRAEVYALIATDAGRERFWAERSREEGDRLVLDFPNGERLETRILERVPDVRFAFEYFEGSRAELSLSDGDGGGTVVRIHETNLDEATALENRPGWVSVLLNLKAVAQHGADLRNHDARLSWSQGFVDN